MWPKNEINTIPPNCKYITSVACGITRLKSYNDIWDNFLENNLEQPITRQSLKKYERLIVIAKSSDTLITRNQEYRIHYDGEKFVIIKIGVFIS